MKISQKFSLLFFLSKKRADRNGYCPIYMRITIDGKRSPDLSLGFKVLSKYWDNTQKKVVGLATPEAKSINLKILQTKADYETQFTLLGSQYGDVTVDMLIKAVRPFNQNDSVRQSLPVTPTELHKRIDAMFIRCREYYRQEKKVLKTADERIRASEVRTLNKEKAIIKDEIEMLTSLSLDVYTLIANEEKTVMDASYEFLITFLRKSVGGTRAFSTCKKWWVTKDKIKQFLSYTYKRNSYTLLEVTRVFAERFYDYLTLVHSCGHNSAMKIIKNTRQIIERAIVSGWLATNPLGNFRCSYIDPDREALTVEVYNPD
ncbi:phage integrase SAM-like domain-containing protein [Chitinophaga sp. GbtcB8]|uniref:phage integrase SAM-like domain-containing protein n=1 Tax=Chitinophaga sp. GbtcB8 TaxID=2824753 RepID=UPI001C307B49|nr:phage integrase SAM-like domain-containing protein [Chitinophaga sp. GbtcB8]